MPALRISYHDADRLALIAGPVRAAFDRLTARLPGCPVFFRSGWLNGPHVDLAIASDDAIDLAAEQALIAAWLAEHPSTTRIDPAEYERSSRQLGALEGVAGPYGPLRPNNQVSIEPYRAPRLVDGHDVLGPTYARFLGAAAPILFDLAEVKRAEPPAASLALTAMLAIAADHFGEGGIRNGYLSLQAHADFFFGNYDSTGQMRARFDALERRSRPALDRIAAGAPESAFPPARREAMAALFARWRAVLAAALADIDAVIARDSSWFFYNPAAFPDGAGDDKYAALYAEAGIAPRKIEKGATLERMADALDTDFFQSPLFQRFRILINMYYSTLPALGVSPAERFCMCHLVAQAALRLPAVAEAAA